MLWQVWKQSLVWRVRPSNLLGIVDEVQAFAVDEIVFVFGNHVQNAIDEVPLPSGKNGSDRQAKDRQELMQRMLGLPTEVKGKFKDPATMFEKG